MRLFLRLPYLQRRPRYFPLSATNKPYKLAMPAITLIKLSVIVACVSAEMSMPHKLKMPQMTATTEPMTVFDFQNGVFSSELSVDMVTPYINK
nr:MAG TPA: hypothetical protein [Caudoviricetes sp.]